LVIFVGKRLLQLVPVLFGVVTITFFFTHVAVPDPCAAWTKARTPGAVQACVVTFGFDKPLWVQYTTYLQNLISGNWGVNSVQLPVLPQILQFLPETLELVLASLLVMIVLGIPLGVVAANGAGRWPDHLVRTFYLSGWATPTFLGGLILAIVVGPALGLPYAGDFTTQPPPFPEWTHMSVLDALLAGNLAWTGDAILHLILPATALAFLNMGIATRMTRGSMLEVLPMDYVKTARMKGLTNFWVLYRHALRNSLISTTTVLGIAAGGLLSGTVVIEYIFRWPGIGIYAYNAITGYEFAETIGVVIVFAVGVVVANLIADVLYGLLDPRVEWR
jgi:ABC-type dipeptide/oligopeptide/nickel transport system permease component